jgi:hypothetical protein
VIQVHTADLLGQFHTVSLLFASEGDAGILFTKINIAILTPRGKSSQRVYLDAQLDFSPLCFLLVIYLVDFTSDFLIIYASWFTVHGGGPFLLWKTACMSLSLAQVRFGQMCVLNRN